MKKCSYKNQKKNRRVIFERFKLSLLKNTNELKEKDKTSLLFKINKTITSIK